MISLGPTLPSPPPRRPWHCARVPHAQKRRGLLNLLHRLPGSARETNAALGRRSDSQDVMYMLQLRHNVMLQLRRDDVVYEVYAPGQDSSGRPPFSSHISYTSDSQTAYDVHRIMNRACVASQTLTSWRLPASCAYDRDNTTLSCFVSLRCKSLVRTPNTLHGGDRSAYET